MCKRFYTKLGDENMNNRKHVFSIRKSVYGAASVVVATCFFVVGGQDVQAAEGQPEHVGQPTEVVKVAESGTTQTEDAQPELSHVEKDVAVQQPSEVETKPSLDEQLVKTEVREALTESDNNHNVTGVAPTTVAAPVDKTTAVPKTQDAQSELSVTEAPKVTDKALTQDDTNVAEVNKAEKEIVHTDTQLTDAKEVADNQTEARSLRKAASPVETANPEQPLNKHPFVFVHGFMGLVGDVAPKGINYWGGTKANLQEYLRNKGYEMYEASVSAIASNHERVVDLYHYIVGGRADYGAAHAEKYGHERYGKTYKGIYPDWQPGKPIHLVGHSMGGQTIRLLEHYLRNGNQEELAYQQQHGGTLSPLYQGGHDNMVSSITTIATPHNGTHAADQLGNTPFIRHLLYGLTRTFGNHAGTLDLGMHHWGFKQREGESLIDYGKRVAQSQLWDSEDTALYDLTTTGAEKLNQLTTVNPNIYYKTFTGQATHKVLSGKHMIDFGMAFAHVLTGNLIGSVMEEIWRPNDGLVSVVSAQHPTGEAHVDVTADAPLQKGVWQVMPTMSGWDHSDFIGNDTLDAKHSAKQLTDFYDEIADYLMRIESAEHQTI